MAKNLKLLPILENLSENKDFIENSLLDQASLKMCIDFYKKVSFHPPWICYYVEKDKELIAGAAFKGKPVEGKIEIAYGVFPKFMNQGFGTECCRMLVELALKTDPSVIITARTLPEENYSARILRKNGFKLLGNIYDEEDGDIWEWEYVKT
jgi:RimJ/RimL family protein N-acetyltransferase